MYDGQDFQPDLTTCQYQGVWSPPGLVCSGWQDLKSHFLQCQLVDFDAQFSGQVIEGDSVVLYLWDFRWCWSDSYRPQGPVRRCHRVVVVLVRCCEE